MEFMDTTLLLHYELSEDFIKKQFNDHLRALGRKQEFRIVLSSYKGMFAGELLQKLTKYIALYGEFGEKLVMLNFENNYIRSNLLRKHTQNRDFSVDEMIDAENVIKFLDYFFRIYESIEEEERKDSEETELLKFKKIELEKEKSDWVGEFGSEQLKKTLEYGYDCQKLYVEERAKVDFPEFTPLFDSPGAIKERCCPSMTALRVEEYYRKRKVENLKIRWLELQINGEKTAFEGVVITNYLSKYTLYSVII